MRFIILTCCLSGALASHAAELPAWQTSTLYDDLGKGDRVPAPWTPVRAEGQTLSCWGRSVRWAAGSLLPASLKTQGQEVLAGPMTLAVTCDGRTRPVPLQGFRVTSRSRSRVSFVATGGAEDIAFRLDGWLEYDGFMWFNLSAAAPPGRQISSLRVQTPLRADAMRLYQAFARPLAGAIGREPIQFPWMSNAAESIADFYHWFGNEDLGLGFTYTSLEHWAPASEDNIATLTPGPRETTYAIHLIEKPVTINGRVFRFGVQATPIKPLPGDYGGMLAATYYRDAWRASEQLKPNMDMMLIWPLDTGIMKGLNDPYGLDAKRMADLVNEAHSVGLPMLTIAACPQKVSHTVPELTQYRDEWRTEPASVLAWDQQPQLQNCGKSATLRKWLFYGWTIENVRKFGTDGVYFDGWQAGTIACANARHGCGWTDAEGKRHVTVPVLEGREFNQRLLLFLQEEAACRAGAVRSGAMNRAQDAKGAMNRATTLHYWIHSWEFAPSVMGFATEWLTGEFAGWPLQGPSMLKPEGTYGKCLGLDLFRARCLSTNWGVPNLFDALMWEHTQDCPTDKQTLMAYAWFLPHGVSPALIHYMNQKTVVAITQVFNDFRARQARFTPGWRPNAFWKIEGDHPREIMVATWDHGAGKPVLAVVSNLQAEAEATVRLKWLGQGNPQLRNARTGEALALARGVLTLKLPPESFVLLRSE